MSYGQELVKVCYLLSSSCSLHVDHTRPPKGFELVNDMYRLLRRSRTREREAGEPFTDNTDHSFKNTLLPASPSSQRTTSKNGSWTSASWTRTPSTRTKRTD